MAEKQKKSSFELGSLVENQLNLQVKISYPEHHDFMIRHQLGKCARVLDVGTGNGTFAGRLAQDHPTIEFVGIDKRKHCIERCKQISAQNFKAETVDLFTRESQFDFSLFDGFLMRYFLLHVDHSKKILERLKVKSKRPARFWIIDLDFTQFTCEPKNEHFDQLIQLVKDFCLKTSIDSMAGQRVLPMLKELEFKNIVVENLPFSTKTISIDELALYLKQEVQLYSRMSGRQVNDPETGKIVGFIDEEVRSGNFQVSYGMILLYAELN